MSFCGLCGGGRSADDPEHECGAVRTSLQEAVLLAAVRVRNAGNLDCDGPGFLEVDTAIRALDSAVDALLAAEPTWGEGK